MKLQKKIIVVFMPLIISLFFIGKWSYGGMDSRSSGDTGGESQRSADGDGGQQADGGGNQQPTEQSVDDGIGVDGQGQSVDDSPREEDGGGEASHGGGGSGEAPQEREGDQQSHDFGWGDEGEANVPCMAPPGCVCQDYVITCNNVGNGQQSPGGDGGQQNGVSVSVPGGDGGSEVGQGGGSEALDRLEGDLREGTARQAEIERSLDRTARTMQSGTDAANAAAARDRARNEAAIAAYYNAKAEETPKGLAKAMDGVNLFISRLGVVGPSDGKMSESGMPQYRLLPRPTNEENLQIWAETNGEQQELVSENFRGDPVEITTGKYVGYEQLKTLRDGVFPVEFGAWDQGGGWKISFGDIVYAVGEDGAVKDFSELGPGEVIRMRPEVLSRLRLFYWSPSEGITEFRSDPSDRGMVEAKIVKQFVAVGKPLKMELRLVPNVMMPDNRRGTGLVATITDAHGGKMVFDQIVPVSALLSVDGRACPNGEGDWSLAERMVYTGSIERVGDQVDEDNVQIKYGAMPTRIEDASGVAISLRYRFEYDGVIPKKVIQEIASPGRNIDNARGLTQVEYGFSFIGPTSVPVLHWYMQGSNVPGDVYWAWAPVLGGGGENYRELRVTATNDALNVERLDSYFCDACSDRNCTGQRLRLDRFLSVPVDKSDGFADESEILAGLLLPPRPENIDSYSYVRFYGELGEYSMFAVTENSGVWQYTLKPRPTFVRFSDGDTASFDWSDNDPDARRLRRIIRNDVGGALWWKAVYEYADNDISKVVIRDASDAIVASVGDGIQVLGNVRNYPIRYHSLVQPNQTLVRSRIGNVGVFEFDRFDGRLRKRGIWPTSVEEGGGAWARFYEFGSMPHESYDWEPDGTYRRLMSYTNSNNIRTEYDYDDNATTHQGKFNMLHERLVSPGGETKEWSYTYEPRYNMIKTSRGPVDPGVTTYFYCYENEVRGQCRCGTPASLARIVYPDGQREDFTYDQYGRMTEYRGITGVVTRWEYNTNAQCKGTGVLAR